MVTWEHWLESNHHLRDVDRYFFASFLIIFLLFYAITTGMAVESLARSYPQQERCSSRPFPSPLRSLRQPLPAPRCRSC